MMSLPLPLEIASKSTLTYWAMEGFQGMLWNGLSFTDTKILKALGVQWLWTILLSTVSWFAFAGTISRDDWAKLNREGPPLEAHSVAARLDLFGIGSLSTRRLRTAQTIPVPDGA